VGLRYLWGQSVAQDDQEAARWLKLAADQGVAPAAAALKNRYANGEGVPRDLVEACKWGIVAGAQNDPTTSDTNLTDLEDKLTPGQLAEAQRRAKEFVPKRTGPSDP
jgi:TPR repeat protein